MSTLADRCRVVLVRPMIAANIGATARVMRNFGLDRLRLVAPIADPLDEQARKLSTHGEGILHAAERFESLGEAVADCVVVAGTSARLGGRFRSDSVGTLRSLMPRLVAAMVEAPVALVFGPEQTGLTNEEVTLCHFLMTVPADGGYPVLNLAQAVAIVLYEFYQASSGAVASQEGHILANFAAQDRMYRELEKGLRDIHFLWDANADALWHAVRHLLGRAMLSTTEVRILHGLARQLQAVGRDQANRPTAGDPGSSH